MKLARQVEGSGPALVFVHGLTSSGQAWEPVTDILTGEFTCVRLDLRGHGASGPADDYSMPSMVADVRELVEELALEDPAIVGHSLGAAVAAVYAAAHGARAVVCVDNSLRFGDFARFLGPYAGALRGGDTMETLIEIEHALNLEPYEGIEELEGRVRAFPPEVVLGVWDTLLTTPPDELTATAEAILPRIEAPLLALHGSRTPPDYEPWLTNLVPSARVEVWDGMGHMLHLVDPARFAERLRDWV